MNIWVIGRSYPTKQNKMRGSFELEQAKLLEKHGHNVSYIAAVFHPINKIKKWGYATFSDGNIQVYVESVFFAPERMHLHISVIQKIIWKKLLSTVQREQGVPDIIHVHYPGMVSVPEVVCDYKKVGTKIVITDHWSKTMLNTMDNYQKKQLISFVNCADAVLCVGRPLKNAILKLTGTEKEIRIVPNVVSPLFQEKCKMKENEFDFIVVGRLSPIKQIDKIVLAFAKVFSQTPNVYLTIVGDGTEKSKIIKIINDYAIQPQVRLTGTLSREDTAEEVLKADALVCYSQWETFGVPIIEAWACGKPVILSENVGAAEYWNERLGYIVQHDNLDTLQQAMKDLYDNRKEYDHSYISKYAENHFGEEAVYKELQIVYENLVKDRE